MALDFSRDGIDPSEQKNQNRKKPPFRELFLSCNEIMGLLEPALIYGCITWFFCNSLCFCYSVLFSCLFETNKKQQQMHATRQTKQNNSIKHLNLASQATPELRLTGQISPLLYKIINHLSSYSCCCAKIHLQKELLVAGHSQVFSPSWWQLTLITLSAIRK